MNQGSRVYLPGYNLPMHTAPWPCEPGHSGVTPRCKMAQDCLIASRICPIVVSTKTDLWRIPRVGITSDEREVGNGKFPVFTSSSLRLGATSRTVLNTPSSSCMVFTTTDEKMASVTGESQA
jgi:hypothetical protein